MAKFHGLVKFQDGTIKHIIWNGFSDICFPRIYKTFEETDNNWDTVHDEEYDTDCCHIKEEIIIFNGYSYWHGIGCRECNSILKNTSYDQLDNLEEQIFEIPEWVKEYCINYNREYIIIKP